jgi:DNA repair protein RadC
MIAADDVDTLRAIFVDEQTRLVRIERIGSARDFWPTDRYRCLFDRAYTARAAGVIFARGHRAGPPFVTAEERHLALDLARHGTSLDVAVLDYIVIGGTEAKGVLAMHEVDRL